MQPKRELSLFDSTCIIVGVIVGAGIFETVPTVAGNVHTPTCILLTWLAGGLLALTGALCYSELATTYPHQGGDYIYLNRAYGGWAGYLFGWSQLVIIRPGDIALMAFIFARYAQTLYSPFANSDLFYAGLAVVVLTLINIGGVKEGKWTQNIFTVAKAVGLLAIIIAGFIAPGAVNTPHEPEPQTLDGLKLALILIMFTFGGWNEIVYVSAEVKSPERNIIRSLVLGTTAVTVLYLLVNAAYLTALGIEGVADSRAVAVDTLSGLFPEMATRAVNVLVCVSALGAVNGLVLTGARISYAMGQDHILFRRLGRWNNRLGTPGWALVFQGVLSLGIIILARSFIDTILYTAPVVWLFFLASGISLFVLRHKDHEVPRPYKVVGYPIIPVLFCLCSTFMLYSSVTYAMTQKPFGLGVSCAVLLAGAMTFIIAKQKHSPNRSQ